MINFSILEQAIKAGFVGNPIAGVLNNVSVQDDGNDVIITIAGLGNDENRYDKSQVAKRVFKEYAKFGYDIIKTHDTLKCTIDKNKAVEVSMVVMLYEAYNIDPANYHVPEINI